MKLAFTLFTLALLCLFAGIVAALWVPTNLCGTVLGSGFWLSIGFACLGGLSIMFKELSK